MNLSLNLINDMSFTKRGHLILTLSHYQLMTLLELFSL